MVIAFCSAIVPLCATRVWLCVFVFGLACISLLLSCGWLFVQTSVSRLTLAEPYSVEVFIFDIREGVSGMKPGFLLLKALAAKVAALEPGTALEADGSHERNTVRILVAGGDGTVMWCLDEMKRTGVNGEVCAVGVVPYGTGETTAEV